MAQPKENDAYSPDRTGHPSNVDLSSRRVAEGHQYNQMTRSNLARPALVRGGLALFVFIALAILTACADSGSLSQPPGSPDGPVAPVEPANPSSPDDPSTDPGTAPPTDPGTDPLPGPAEPPPEPALEAPRAEYYVSVNGDDDNDGRTPATAWRTLARVASHGLEPGDHVLLERGNIFRETLYITDSGAQDLPVVYRAYGDGPAPVVSGADLVRGWRTGSSGSFSAPLASAPARVWVDGEELSRAGGVNDLRDRQFAFDGSRLHVRLAGGKSPEGRRVEAAQRPAAVSDTEGHSHIMIMDLVGEKANGTSKNDAVFNALGYSDGWTLYRTVARDGAANGFFAEQSSRSGIGSNLRIIDSESTNNKLRGAVAAGAGNKGQLFYGLYSHHNGKDGLLINSQSGRLIASRLENNGTVGNAPDHAFYIYPWNGGGTNWQILDNQLSGNRTSGGRIAGTGHLVSGNVVADNPYGFFVVDNDGPNDDHVIEDNVIVNTDPWSYAVNLEGAVEVVVRNNMLVDAAGIGIVPGVRRVSQDLRIVGNRFGGDRDGAFVYEHPTQDGSFSGAGNCFDPALHLDAALADLEARRKARGGNEHPITGSASSDTLIQSSAVSTVPNCA